MFEKIRKPGRAKSLISYIIFGLICLVFVFIGVPIDQMSNMGGAAIVVNNEVISWSEYQNALEMLEQQSASRGGPDLDTKRQEQLRSQAISNLLNLELISQTAQRVGVVVARRAIQDKIKEVPLFQEEGRFKHSRYISFLEARRLSASYYEDLVTKDIKTSRFQNMFNWTIDSSKEEKEKKDELSMFKVQVSYIQFPTNSLSPEEFNNLSDLIKENEMGLLEQMLIDKKWKWEDTDSFDLSRVALPGLNEQKTLFNEVLKYLPNKGLIKRVISSRDQSFILKITNFEQNTVASLDSSENPLLSLSDSFFMDRMSAQMVFLSWINSARLMARLKFNPRLKDIAQ